ncbi:uncharacterized protein BKA78DRAFT_321311, partial [Phyllosticta capitalensis]|uniref:uncharacterized protein n=1 Tax=Phyllosticta capitalensis TaxID=121624 RepID=UPI00313191F0
MEFAVLPLEKALGCARGFDRSLAASISLAFCVVSGISSLNRFPVFLLLSPVIVVLLSLFCIHQDPSTKSADRWIRARAHLAA